MKIILESRMWVILNVPCKKYGSEYEAVNFVSFDVFMKTTGLKINFY